MFTLKNVRIITCEEKPWEMNGKSGFFYPTTIRIGNEIFNITSKINLTEHVDRDCSLAVELQAKIPKNGSPYTGVRITDIV